MPQARKSSRSSSSRASRFKEPAALKRLNTSLDSAQKAITELRNHAGRDAAQSTRTLYQGLGKFVKDARRDSGKFASSLKKDFEQAAKTAQSATKRTSTTGTRRGGGTSRAGASRSTSSRAGSTRSRTSGSSTRRTPRKPS